MLTGRLTGRWWLPESPHRKLTGTLILDWDRRPRLEMVGLLEGVESFELDAEVFGMPQLHRTVLGLTTDHRPVTLRHARRHVREMHLHDPDGAYIELEASEALVGVHSESPSDTYEQLTLRLTRLLDWVEAPRLANRYEHDGQRFVKVEHAWSPWSTPVLELADGTVSVRIAAAEFGDGVRERGIRQVAHLVVRSQRPLVAGAWYERWIKPMRDLVTFSTGLPSEILYVGLQPLGQADSEVEWVWERSGPGSEEEGTLWPDELLMSLLDAGDSAADVLNCWVTLCREDQDIVNYFLGPRYSTGMYEENRLLNIVQALEALHRRQYGERRTRSDEEQARLDRLLAACPTDDREWLASQLKHTTRISLRERLRALVREHA